MSTAGPFPSSARARLLGRHELEVAAETLVAAFDADPLFRWLVPGDRARRAWLRWFQRSSLALTFELGGAYTLDGGPELGAIAVVPPGRWPPSGWTMVRTTAWPPLAWPTARLLRRGPQLLEEMHRHHLRERHLYVYQLGVHPSRQGQRLGATLLGHALDLAAEERVPLYLETANPANLPFYRRHGFEVTGEVTSHGGPPLFLMRT